jgi:hypothetical protein
MESRCDWLGLFLLLFLLFLPVVDYRLVVLVSV